MATDRILLIDKLECVKPLEGKLIVGKEYERLALSDGYYYVEYEKGKKEWFGVGYFIRISRDNIKPEHYNKGGIDLYESWYLTRPFNEFRAIMESVAERYMKRDKLDRLEDLDKCMETLRRLREYEVRHKEEK